MARRLQMALDELRRSEERWYLALLGSNDGIWDWDPRTDEIFLSSRWKSMLGYDEDEFVGPAAQWRELVHPDDLAGVMEAFEKHRSGRSESFVAEYRMRVRDGQYRWILSRAKGWRNEKGELARVVGSQSDITAHKEALERAEAASRAKSSFVANVSHEIRTPMNAVLGYAELLRGAKTETERREYLDELTITAKALQELLGQLLDLSRIESGKLQLEERSFRLRDLVDGTVALFRGLARQKAVTLEATVAAGMPEYLSGDEARLRQILMNLVGNAVKFTPRGRVGIEVMPASEEAGRFVVRVWDEGPGIPAAARERIFEPFYQGDTSETRSHGGIGLGLTIAQRLAEQMGGRIELEEDYRAGTAFRFWAPLKPAQMEVEAKPAKLPSVEGNQSARVLLVEDNVVNQRVATRLLERHGHQVRVAPSGEDAVRIAQEDRFDLILMDLHMPGMGGEEATIEIRRREGNAKRTPIWALTAAVSEAEKTRCDQAGMDGFLAKPIDLQSLLKAVEMALSGKDQR